MDRLYEICDEMASTEQFVTLRSIMEKYYGSPVAKLDGDKEYDTDFILTWKDGSQDVIHFTRKINDILDTEDQWLLNGEKVEQTGNCGVFTITR
jgi:hypothetical protein